MADSLELINMTPEELQTYLADHPELFCSQIEGPELEALLAESAPEQILALPAPPAPPAAPVLPRDDEQPSGAFRWGRFTVAEILRHKKRGPKMTFVVKFVEIKGEFTLSHRELMSELPGLLGEYLTGLTRRLNRSWTIMVRLSRIGAPR